MKWRYSDRFSSLPALVLEVEIVATGTDRFRRVPAKIDTGSDITVVPESLVVELRLLEFGKRLLRAVGHPAYRSMTYYGTIVVESRSFDVEMATQDRPYVLLGRDVINQFVLHADGVAEIFELTWPSPLSAKRRRLRKR